MTKEKRSSTFSAMEVVSNRVHCLESTCEAMAIAYGSQLIADGKQTADIFELIRTALCDVDVNIDEAMHHLMSEMD